MCDAVLHMTLLDVVFVLLFFNEYIVWVNLVEQGL